MSKTQLHKRLTTEQTKSILEKYKQKQIRAKEAINFLDISRARFYQLVDTYKQEKKDFSITYRRKTSNRKLDTLVEKNVLQELKIDKEKIIDNPDVPIRRYNYSYIKRRIQDTHNQCISVPTIIHIAKSNGHYIPRTRTKKKSVHDREVITNYAGELAQHDASRHLFAPDAGQKWYLIHTVDDFSRLALYADLWEKETTYTHIFAAQSVFLKHGCPLSYYVDSHRIFRYIKARDKYSPWAVYTKFTDEVDPQWKQVVQDCGVRVTYAQSAPAKGKIERPFGWLQDHLIRTCVREGITTLEDGRAILQKLIKDYNTKWVHSSTGEIPVVRFQRALQEQQSLFRQFKVKEPFRSVKDIFCLRIQRTVDAYRNVSLNTIKLKVPKGVPRQNIELRLYPDLTSQMVEIRFWQRFTLLGVQRLKMNDLPMIHWQ